MSREGYTYPGSCESYPSNRKARLMTVKISSRSREVAERIRDREAFDTYGALRATWTEGSATGWLGAGSLNAEEANAFYTVTSTREPIYVVWSYRTPIAWWTAAGGWHKADQKFSVTTSRHQGKLYLIDTDYVGPCPEEGCTLAVTKVNGLAPGGVCPAHGSVMA